MPSLLLWVRVLDLVNCTLLTAAGPRNRAPLGMKTTNAKAKGFQTPGPALEKELDKTQPKPQTSNRKPKRVIHADAVKVDVHGDESPLAERDVEYCPPKPKDLPYESDTFPDGCLDFTLLNPENLMRGVFQAQFRKVAAQREREDEEAYQKAMKAGEERILASLEEEWTVGDVPETFRHLRKKQVIPRDQPEPKPIDKAKQPLAISSKGPATVRSRRAASALSVAPKPSLAPPRASKPAAKPSFLTRQKAIPHPSVPSNASTMRAAAAVATSRSTIGHTKGRSVSGILHTQPTAQAPVRTQRNGLARSVSMMSNISDATITPARFAQKEIEDWRRPAFMSAFDIEDDEPLGGRLAECLRRADEEEDEFVMTLPAEGL